MGKASTWFKNFLMGKRDDRVKNKKPDHSFTPEEPYHFGTPMPNLSGITPKVKRRWSFKRQTSTKSATHKINRSFDSINMPRQGLLEYETQQINILPLLLKANVAATRIQAAYRSYLARRALRALRALVKLQAVTRGYLVRKQMNAVMRSMRAVQAIQIRARVHRVQMADDPIVALENVSSERRPQQMRGVLRSQSVRVDHTLPERAVEHCFSKHKSGRLSVSQRECPPKMPPSPSTSSFTYTSSTTYDGQYNECYYRMEQKSSRRHDYSARPENKQALINPFVQYSDDVTSNSELAPNYMTNTESSKAKSRSHSEPRQRPKSGRKQKSRRTSSMDEKNETDQYSWLIKLYRSSNVMNDRDCSFETTGSSNKKLLIPFESHVEKMRRLLQPSQNNLRSVVRKIIKFPSDLLHETA